MGILGVEEQHVTGVKGYCNAKTGKYEVDNWMILEEIRGSRVGRHITVREIIVFVGLKDTHSCYMPKLHIS